MTDFAVLGQVRAANILSLYCFFFYFRVTSQLGKRFCPSCGNSTLVRLSVSVDEDGVTHYQVPNRKRPFNIRGKKVNTQTFDLCR